MFVVVVLVAT